MIPGHRRLGVRIAARLLVVTVAFGVLGLATAGSGATDADVSGPAYVAAIVLIGWLLFGLYELTARGTAGLLGRMAGPLDPDRLRRPTVFTPLRALVVLATYVVGGAIAMALLVAVVRALGGKVALDTVVTGRYSWIMAASLVAGAAAAWGMFRVLATRRDLVRLRRWLRSPGGQTVRTTVLGAMLFALFVAFVLPFLLPTSQSYEPGTISRMASASGWPRFWLALIGVGVAPPVEETLFRGVLLESFIRRLRRFSAILFTTLFFVLAHFPDIMGSWPAIAAIGGGGWALAELRLRTRSLVPSVAAHMAYNGVLLALAFL